MAALAFASVDVTVDIKFSLSGLSTPCDKSGLMAVYGVNLGKNVCFLRQSVRICLVNTWPISVLEHFDWLFFDLGIAKNEVYLNLM